MVFPDGNEKRFLLAAGRNHIQNASESRVGFLSALKIWLGLSRVGLIASLNVSAALAAVAEIAPAGTLEAISAFIVIAPVIPIIHL